MTHSLGEARLLASYALARQAAHDAAGPQHYPAGALYMVATPIGNLADISLRALHVLTLADTLACEDTRHSQTLLRAYGLDKAPSQWLAAHQHNEAQVAQTVVQRLKAGQRVAFVSDAGTPAISDPGTRLAQVVRAAGLRVIPLPGASAVTTLLSAAGVPDDNGQGFVFAGFLPSKATAREATLQDLARQARAVVLLEAPHRIEALAQALACLGQRTITVGRELTKQFEDITTLAADQLAPWLAQDANRSRGEFALVIHPAQAASDDALDTRVLGLLLPELPLKTAVRLAAEITGQSRNALYEVALALKSQPTLD
jgi:16S rRNA (cytidine1402-2'-O)-methyltransferase